MSAPKDRSSPPIVTYEPAFAQQRFHARIRIAIACGLAPLIPLITTLIGAVLTHDRSWLLAAIATVILSHGVVGLGLFLICMEYAVQRDRLLPMSQFLRESQYALLALGANWPLFISIVFIAWHWT
jgi:hypothetical protein